MGERHTCARRFEVLILTGEHEGLGLRGHGCDLDAKGRGDAFVSIGIGRKFRTAQMVTVEEVTLLPAAGSLQPVTSKAPAPLGRSRAVW